MGASRVGCRLHSRCLLVPGRCHFFIDDESLLLSALTNQKVLIDSIKIFFRQFLVGAEAKGVNCVDAAVIARPVSFGDHVEGYLDLSCHSVLHNILAQKISAFFLPSPLKLVIDHFSVHSCIDVAVAAFLSKKVQ